MVLSMSSSHVTNRIIAPLCVAPRAASGVGGRLPAGPAGGRLPGEGRSPRRPAARRLAAPRARIGGGGVSGGGLEAGGIGW